MLNVWQSFPSLSKLDGTDFCTSEIESVASGRVFESIGARVSISEAVNSPAPPGVEAHR